MAPTNNNPSQNKPDITLTHPKYRTDLDGLRGIAVLSVVIFHAFPLWVKGGYIGVDIFFVISGYLISTIIFSNLDSKTFSFKGFYSRRIRRIFPALLLVLTACYVLGWFVLMADEFKLLGKHIVGGAEFISNFLLQREEGYFDKATDIKPLLHLWSLGIEEQFYIVFPILIWFAYKIRFNLVTLMATVAFVSFSLNVAQIHLKPIATFYSPIPRFWELIAGGLLAHFDYKKKMVSAIAKWSLLPDAKSVLGFLCIALALGMLTTESSFPGWWALLPVLGSVLIISAGSQAFLNRTVLSNKLLVWFGLISYPLYLWHHPLLSFSHIVEGRLSVDTRIALVIISILLAWVTYLLIEKPIRFGAYNRIKVTLLCVLMVMAGFMGFITSKCDGFPSRGISFDLLNQHQLTWYKPSQECISLIGLEHEINEKSEIFCSFSGEKEHLKVAILGDSTANALMPGFQKIYKDKNIGVINIGNATCAPFRGLKGSLGYNKDCEEVNRKAYDYVLKNPSIKTIILGFIPYDIKLMGMGTLKADAALGDKMPVYSSLVQKNISALKKAGKNVVVIFDGPLLNIDPTNCLARPFKMNNTGCNRVESESYVNPFMRYGEDLFKKNKDVCIFYQSQGLKSGDYFNVLDSRGILLFRDDRHLSYNGSDKVAHDFMNSECFKYID
ncbi:MAG: acyltransferase [Candidatus Omnitrophica bacterium]|nr:acyltransferase [Candidatus Omnitrophota bacterium]